MAKREVVSVKALFRKLGSQKINTLTGRMERKKWVTQALWNLLTHGFVEFLPDESGERIRLEITLPEWVRLANAAIEVMDEQGPIDALYSSDIIIINDVKARDEQNRLPAPDN